MICLVLVFIYWKTIQNNNNFVNHFVNYYYSNNNYNNDNYHVD